MTRSAEATGWLLTIEPLGESVTWSLLRNDGATTLVDVGHLPSAGHLQEMARRLQPVTTTLPTAAGTAGLWASALCEAGAERDTTAALGSALLPAALRVALLARRDQDAPDLVTIAARGWLASLPWDLLGLAGPGGPRLLERACVVAGLSPVITATRHLSSPPRDPASAGCAAVDPGPPLGPAPTLYPAGIPDRLTCALTAADDTSGVHTRGMTPEELAYHLHQHPSRLLYVGHIHTPPRQDEAAAAAFILRGPTPTMPARLTARQWIAEPNRWPAPPRVALIGCASNDATSYEQTGLVVAAVNAGAHLVTATRWPLPTDNPDTRGCTPHQPVHHEALTDLAVAVHAAHISRDPLTHLRAWQLTRLHRWKTTGDIHHSPLLWASPLTYLTPPAPHGATT